jgi:4-cresol dehydrogenase (hydroxylating)
LLRKDVSKLIGVLRPLFGLTRGVPTDQFLASTYWRKREAPSALTDPDPERDRCGQLWIAPIAPLSGAHAQTIYRIASEAMLAHGFEPMVSITLLTPRAMDCVLGIAYDRDVPGEDQRALDCHDVLLTRLVEAGYYPYRLSLASMGRLPPPQPGYAGFRHALKQALDPSGILAPGRYEEAPET